MSDYTLIEPCAGSAALTMHLLGARRAILPYQGSKWRHRKQLTELAESAGFTGRPYSVKLSDPGPWGKVWAALFKPRYLSGITEALQRMSDRDPLRVFNSLQGCRAPLYPVAFAADFLFLQRLAFSGKAVGIKDGCWASPGFNKTSAYGTPATERFGAVRPMVPSLVDVLKSYEQLSLPYAYVTRGEAVTPLHGFDYSRALVYIDPPYAETTAYPSGAMTRTEVIALALAWHEAGATVMVSEQSPLDIPGWSRHPIHTGRSDGSPFKGKQAEWVTMSPGGAS